jgi:Flp pilus assembly pilin Flp
MFIKLSKNKKAQQTAEYALLISLVVAAVIAMQTYAQRTIQARIRDASSYLTSQTSDLGDTNQYEPYYLESSYDVVRDDTEVELQTQRADNSGLFAIDSVSNRVRLEGGVQKSNYNTAYGVINGI